MNIVLMAGGGGTRLWPLSRQDKPKQFLDLGTGKTLIEMAYARAVSLVPAENVYVATAQVYAPYIEKLLPQIDREHVFYEPQRRDTTAAFATVVLRLQQRGQGEVPTLFMWSDHVFTNEAEFLHDLGQIESLLQAHQDFLIVTGHSPLSPETVLGYIEAGEPVDGYPGVFRVKAFKEKPDRATAEQFVAAGNYFWNLGYFSLLPNYLIAQLEQQPDVAAAMKTYKAALESGGEEELTAAYSEFPKVSIEYTFVEKTPNILAVTGDYGWSDVGSWAVVSDIFGVSGDHMPRGHHISVDSQNNYIYNTTATTVSLIGLKDTIVVITDDAVLVTDKDQSHKVKEVVARLEQDNKRDVL